MSERIRLEDVAHINPESLGPSTDPQFRFRYIDLSSVSRGSIDWAATSVHRFRTAPSRARRPLRPGDVLFGTVRPEQRSHALFKGHDEPCVASTGFAVIRHRQGESDPNFLGHFLLSEDIDRQARRAEVGSNYPAVNEADVRAFQVPRLEVHQQRSIAEILDTMDGNVRATRRLVDKLEALQCGLLRERVEHYFGSADLRPLGETLARVMDFRGKTPRKLGMEWGGGDIPALSANNVDMGGIDLSKETYFGSPQLYKRWMTSGRTETGDVLITMEAPLGNIAQIPDDRRYILSQRVVLLRFDSSQLRPWFARWLLTSRRFQGELRRRSTGTTATGIRRAELERIRIPVPSQIEQIRTEQILNACETLILSEKALLAKLDSLRRGCAGDLLTGRVGTVPL